MTDVKSGFAAPVAPAPGEFAATRVALLATRWNVEIIDALLAGARRALKVWGVTDAHVAEVRAPGAYELPLAAHALLHSGRFDAVVALGAVIRGDTPHFDYVCEAVTKGVGDAVKTYKIPVGFGVLTTDNVQQAMDRAGSKDANKGYEALLVAVEMVNVLRQVA